MSISARTVVLSFLVVFVSYVPSTASAGTVYACFQKEKGNLRYVDSPEECLSSEQILSWDDGSGVGDALTDLQARLAVLEGAIQSINEKLACVSPNSDYNNVYFEGCNVHVRNTTGATTNTDGFGNLIVGYDEGDGDKTGSHNLVVGARHTYSSYGGLVAGFSNSVTIPYGSVLGGVGRSAPGNAYGWAAGDVSWHRTDGLLVTTGSIELYARDKFLLDSNNTFELDSRVASLKGASGFNIESGVITNIKGTIVRFNNGSRPVAYRGGLVIGSSNPYQWFINSGAPSVLVP
jgi:hypothetical protein